MEGFGARIKKGTHSVRILVRWIPFDNCIENWKNTQQIKAHNCFFPFFSIMFIMNISRSRKYLNVWRPRCGKKKNRTSCKCPLFWTDFNQDYNTSAISYFIRRSSEVLQLFLWHGKTADEAFLKLLLANAPTGLYRKLKILTVSRVLTRHQPCDNELWYSQPQNKTFGETT